MPAPRSDKPIEFKDGQLSTMTAYLREADNVRLADALHAMLGGMPDFFSGDALVLDFSQLAHEPAQIDWVGLLSLLRRYRLQPIAVRNPPARLADGARAAGLALIPADSEAPVREAPTPVATPEPEPMPVPAAAMVIDRPLRSGQQVYARGSDLIVIGGVSPGAEVIADGSVHCYGPLRGRAIAGAQGAATARIYTTCLGAELVSIAGTFRTFERGLPESLAAKPAQVRLAGGDAAGELCIEPITLD